MRVLNEIQLTKRISICDSLLKRNETDPFLKRIITGHEKWFVYDTVVRKRSWSMRNEPAQSTLKADIHQKNVMLSVWWDFKGIVYFELLPRNQTINSNVYCRQLMKLDKEMKEKWPKMVTRKGVIFHQDNDRHYHLLRSLRNHSNGKTFDSNKAVKNDLIQFFASKNQTFYESGIMKLTER